MIELRKKGENYKINLAKSGKSLVGAVARVKMKWQTAVDLDLHAFAISNSGTFIHVYFANKKSSCSNISLDQDAGVGNVAGNNEENLIVYDLSKVKKVVFVANIFRFFGNLFSSGDNFSKYDGLIQINALEEQVNVYLNSKELGRWAVIASIDMTENSPNVKNIDEILKTEPDLNYITNV